MLGRSATSVVVAVATVPTDEAGRAVVYGTSDAHHVDAARAAGRPAPRPHPACAIEVCH